MQREDNAYDRLTKAVEYPEAWTPEPGDTHVGEALGWETVTVKRDDGTERPCEVLTLRGQDGKEHAVWMWHSVLQNELIGKVQPGDLVALHYRGRRARLSGDGDRGPDAPASVSPSASAETVSRPARNAGYAQASRSPVGLVGDAAAILVVARRGR